jgi:hypothetical protein
MWKDSVTSPSCAEDSGHVYGRLEVVHVDVLLWVVNPSRRKRYLDSRRSCLRGGQHTFCKDVPFIRQARSVNAGQVAAFVVEVSAIQLRDWERAPNIDLCDVIGTIRPMGGKLFGFCAAHDSCAEALGRIIGMHRRIGLERPVGFTFSDGRVPTGAVLKKP